MKKILLFLALSLLPTLAEAQSQRNPCYYLTPSSTGCNSVTSATPLPVTAVSTSGTQDINIKQVQGAVPSLTNPLWITPATGATFGVTQSTSPWVVSNGGTFAVQSSASQNGTWTVQPGNTANTTPWLVTSAGLTAVSSSALAANTVIKASAGNLYSFEVSADSTLSASAWWIMIYNATSAPVDGAVTPLKCYAMPSGSTAFSAAFPTPVAFSTGITIGVSTTGCFTKTASTHAFISGDAQ